MMLKMYVDAPPIDWVEIELDGEYKVVEKIKICEHVETAVVGHTCRIPAGVKSYTCFDKDGKPLWGMGKA